ncbi:MAG: esterase/lipase family protein [Syntrophorhabdaceae bacterium]
MQLPAYHVFRKIIAISIVGILLVVAGCATPIGVGYFDEQESYQNLTANVLTHAVLSARTTQILHRAGLSERFKTEPEEVIARVHEGFGTVNESDLFFALSELSFLHASQSKKRSYYLASAVYAYAFLFSKGTGQFDGFDPRFRTAVDIYNLGIAEGFGSPEGLELDLKKNTYALPFGILNLTADPDTFRWGSYRLNHFINASRLSVRGLRNKYRWPGIGAALVANTLYVPETGNRATSKVPSDVKIAVTAFVRMDDAADILKTGIVNGKLELYTPDISTKIDIEGRSVPLEFDISSALAYTLEDSRVYATETKGFFSGNYTLFKDQKRFPESIFFMTPYRKGCIPVIFIHGTASSSARWVQMLNELQNDRRLWRRYQFWSFTYNTGNPILYSGGILAAGLQDIVRELDPDGTDPALREMVIVGHSQGGLLTKLTAMDSGTRFWDNVTNISFDTVDLSPDTRESLRRSLFYKPLPFVKRVIFISTPHQGSYVAGGFIGRMAGKFITLPFRILDGLTDLATRNPEVINVKALKEIPRSTDNMDPNSLFVRAFSSTAISDKIKAHSIISVSNPDAPKKMWTDGVVKYESAHIDGIESELIVHSGHSTQSDPQTIEEVRRILLLHIDVK